MASLSARIISFTVIITQFYAERDCHTGRANHDDCDTHGLHVLHDQGCYHHDVHHDHHDHPDHNEVIITIIMVIITIIMVIITIITVSMIILISLSSFARPALALPV